MQNVVGGNGIGAALLQRIKVHLLFKAWQLGLYAAPDRRVLENTILPALSAQRDVQRVLFVGVQNYTRHYPALFAGKAFTTMDPDPTVAAMGADRHVVDGVQSLPQHFPPDSFDAIVMNGVIGWGLDRASDIDTALGACAQALRAGGVLVLGVNEQKAGYLDPRGLPAMAGFAPLVFPALATSTLVVETPFLESTHTFMFFQRRPRSL
jgi:SAM-dependent methyltransferase